MDLLYTSPGKQVNVCVVTVYNYPMETKLAITLHAYVT
jgi:hypothetical protein